MSNWRLGKNGEAIYESMSHEDIACRDEELAWLMRQERYKWSLINGRIVESGDPVALQGGLTGLQGQPPAANIATVTSISGTAALWSTSLYTPIPTQGVLTPAAFRIMARGTFSTSTSPGNFGLDPRVGAQSTGGSAISGTTMGASTNVALTASITNAFWCVKGDLTARSVGAAGANSPIIGGFELWSTQATSGGLAGPAIAGAGFNGLMFGGTAASVDLSIANGFSLGVVHTVTTITYVPQQIHWTSWN